MLNQRKSFRERGSLRQNRQMRRRGGFTFVELLAASVIVGTCIAAIVSTWAFAFGLTAKADRQSVGYSLGRRAMEEVKETGFQSTAEGATTTYYDSTGGNRATVATSVHSYAVAVVVSTDVMNGSVPASTALRTVTVTVTFRSTGTTVYQCSTYLARAGI